VFAPARAPQTPRARAERPRLAAQRRFNLIVYLNPGWRAEFGGALELWSSGPGATGAADASAPAPCAAECGARVLPLFNRGVLFSTTAPSLHGFPAPLTCPVDTPRRSLALYYLTPPRADTPARAKAMYVATPGVVDSETLRRLRALRSERRLETADWAPADGA
jgi:hypothetical protein